MSRPDWARAFILDQVSRAKAASTAAGTAFRTPIGGLTRHDVVAFLRRNGWSGSDDDMLNEATWVLQAARTARVKYAGVYCLNRKSRGCGTEWEIVREGQAKKMVTQYVNEAKEVLFSRLDDRVAVAASSDPKVIDNVARLKESIEYGLGVLDRLLGVV